MSMTSAPMSVAPSMNARERAGEDSRMSLPITTSPHFSNETNALPMRYAAFSSSSSGYEPRTSYALKSFENMGHHSSEKGLCSFCFRRLCPESRFGQRRARFSLPQQICGSPPEEPSLPALYDAIAGTLTEEALPSFGTELLSHQIVRTMRFSRRYKSSLLMFCAVISSPAPGTSMRYGLSEG